MSTIKWNPIIEGEELSANRITEVAGAISSEVNNLSAESVSNRGISVDSFSSGLGVAEFKEEVETTTLSLFNKGAGRIGATWPGNPFSGEAEDNRDFKYADNLGSTDVPPAQDQLRRMSVDSNGWRFLQEIRLDTPLDLKSDNSNAALVLSEVHCTKLYSKDENSKAWNSQSPPGGFVVPTKYEGAYDPTPHVLFFTVVCATILDSDDKEYDIPLPNTVRFIDGDTNTNTSSDSDSAWIADSALVGGGQKCVALGIVRKNMPTRTLVTYKDVNSASFNSTDGTPVGGGRLASKSTLSTSAKRIIGFKSFGCIKYCSGLYYHGKKTSAFAEVRDRVLSVLVLNGEHVSTDSDSTPTYP